MRSENRMGKISRKRKRAVYTCGAGQKVGMLLCLAVLLLGGCGRATDEEDNEESRQPIVNFRAITLGNMPEGGMDEIYRQLDALTIPELNCTLRFEFIPWGNERRQLNIVTASGEYDFIPGGVFSDYRTLVYKNAFLDMNPYLDTVPALAEHYAFYDANALKKCEINGGLYGLPQFGQGGIVSVFSTGRICVRSGDWRKFMIWKQWKLISTVLSRMNGIKMNLWLRITGCGAVCGYCSRRGNIWR